MRVSKNKRWLIDQDYLDSLSATDRDFIMSFNKEYYDGGPRKNATNTLHSTTVLRRDCYTRNNMQNRDLYSILGTGSALTFEPVVLESVGANPEDALNEMLDICPSTWTRFANR